jgi:3-oxoacyl-[acyl-carrier-protein] synthase II
MVTYSPVTDAVAITGLGCISSLGSGPTHLVDRLLRGESGVRPIARFDVSRCRAKRAALVESFEPSDYIAPAKLRRIDAVGRLALAATRLALEDAALLPVPNPDRIGIVLGSCTAGVHTTGEYLEGLMKGGALGAPALLFSNTVGNAPASLCALEFGLRGPNTTLNHKEASGFAALHAAVQLLRRDKADHLLSGSAEDVYPLYFEVHDRFRVLSHDGDQPEGSRPFDETRNGFVMGEGAFMLALERCSKAAERGRPVHGVILGVGATGSSEPVNAWPSTPGAMARAMRRALGDAGCTPEEIGVVFAAANGVPAFDAVEADAIVEVFGPRRVPVTSIKGAVGEFGGAATASLVAAVLCAGRGLVPPSGGCTRSDVADRLRIPRAPLEIERPLVIVNSFASGGTCYSIVARGAL